MPRPSPLSRAADYVSVLAVTLVGDEKRPARRSGEFQRREVSWGAPPVISRQRSKTTSVILPVDAGHSPFFIFYSIIYK